MKRALAILGVVGLTVVITYLAVARHLAEERAARLDKALMDAEARLTQLQEDINTANSRLAQLSRMREPSPPPRAPVRIVKTVLPAKSPAAASAGASTTTIQPAPPAEAGAGWAVTAVRPPVVGPLVRYATFARAGGTNRIRIEGTANILHPTWQVESQIISGSAELGPGFPAAPKGVSAGDPVDAKISVSIPVRSLRSVGEEGRPFSDGMDALMCESLREPTNKQITYTLTSLTFQDQPPGTPDQFVYRATGNLCVAGVTNAVTMPVFVTLDGAGSIRFGGSVRVKMSDFKVVPPSINLGVTSLKTGDDVTLRFTWWVRRPGSAQASN